MGQDAARQRTQPTTGRKSVAMIWTRLSPAASCAISLAACALPAASSVAVAVLHAAARVMDSCVRGSQDQQGLSVLCVLWCSAALLTSPNPSPEVEASCLERLAS